MFGLLDSSALTRRSVDSSSHLTLISPSVFSLGSPTACSIMTSCESGASPERLSSKSRGNSGPLCDLSHQCLDTWNMQSVAWVLLAWDIGLKNFSRPVSWCSGTWDSQSVRWCHRVYEVLQKLPRLAHGSQTFTVLLFHLLSTMETLPFPSTGTAQFFA